MSTFLHVCKIIGIIILTLWITSICPGPLTANILLVCGILGIISEIRGIKYDKKMRIQRDQEISNKTEQNK